MKKYIALILALVIVLTFVTCGKRVSNGGVSSILSGSQVVVSSGNNSLKNDPVASFAQFGADVEVIKPGFGEPSEVVIKYGNDANENVYYRKAAWVEKAEEPIDSEVGLAYNESIFEYIKSISADEQVYTNKTTGDVKAVESYGEIHDENLVTLSFKYDGAWVDVYFEYADGGTVIGVTMNGSGSY